MSYRQYSGKTWLDFDPETASEDESLGLLYDIIKRREKDPEFDPAELSRLKREFALRRRSQMEAQQSHAPVAPAPATPEPKKKRRLFGR